VLDNAPVVTARIDGSGAQPQLKRSLGLWQVTVSGVGIVIGAGIYVLIGSAAAEAGNALWLAFIVAALLSALTGLSYAELASMFPSASAEYEFARQAFNEFLGFIAGWVMVLGNLIGAAAVSIGFGHYVGRFADWDYRVSAACLLFFLAVVVLGGLQRSIWLTVFLVVLQVGGLVVVIVAGFPHLGDRDLLAGGSVSGVLGAGALVFFAFIGFDEVVTLSDETRDAKRTIPRALLLALGISTLLYVLVAISAVSVIDAGALAGSDRPLTLVMAHDWGGKAADVVAVIAIASTTNTTLLLMTAASRLIYGMARRGSLPGAFARVARRGSSPYVATLLVLAGTLIFVIPGELKLTASATDLAVYVVFIFVNLAVVILRLRRPDLPRGFQTPGRFGKLPLTPLLAIASVLLMMAFLDASAWLIGGVSLLPGIAVWFLMSRGRAISKEEARPATPRAG
jgi:APA family basic amino acid/polyamine antiporter